MRRMGWLPTLFFAITAFAAAQSHAPAAEAPKLTVKTLTGASVTLTSTDFKARVHLQATDHDGKPHDYSGFDLRALLTQLGAPAGHDVHGKELTDCVIVEGSDGYRVVFSLAELEPQLGDVKVLIADRVDDQPLSGLDGPLRLVVPNDKRPARWVRMLTKLTITRVAE